MGRRNSSLIFMTLIVALFQFLKRVYMADRLGELFVSTIILVGVYYGLYTVRADWVWAYCIPIVVFIIYWCYLLSHEKISSLKANKNWADRSWWWTLDGWEFEEEVAKIFRLNGYKAKVTKKTGDGGIDIILYKNDLKYIVQCKHYQSPLGPEPVRALWGVKDDFGADKVIMVASSGLTSSAYSFISNKKDFELFDLENIIRMGLRPCEKDYVDLELEKN
jgi:hypothetical protein